MNLITQLLAEVTAAANPGTEMNLISTAAIAAVCSLISGIALYTKGRQARTVTIARQPVGVDVADKFVTRTEFAEFKGELKADVREMRGSYEKLVMLINERDTKLTEMIEAVAKGACDGRRRIHEELTAQGKQIAGMAERTDVSKAVGKLGGALMQAIKEIKPPLK